MRVFTNIQSITRFFRISLTLLVLLLSIEAWSQNYPVTCTPIVKPSYSLKWSEISTNNDMFKVHLLLKDLTKISVDVYLKIRLSGVGVDIRTVDGFIPSQTLTLISGEPRMLTASDLAEYFNISNLVVDGVDISALYNGGRLPEGLYTWTVEAYEIDRNRQVSNTGMALMNVFKNYPPIINIPQDGAILPIMTPQNVLFSWTSRSTASLNAAQGKTYKLRIYPLSGTPPDGDDDPNVVANSGIQPIEITTTNPFFSYGAGNIPLEKGKRYAVQVQEEDANGFDDYENEGKSQVVTFSYGKPCVAPEGMVINPIAKGRVELTCEASAEDTETYPVTAWYKTPKTLIWNSVPFNGNSAVISGLKDKTPYEFKLSSACGDNTNTMVALKEGDLLPSGDPSTEPETFTIDDSEFDEEEPEVLDPIILDPYGIGIEINADGTTRPVETVNEVLTKIIKPVCVNNFDAYESCSPNHPAAQIPTGTMPLASLAIGDVLGIYDYAVLVTEVSGGTALAGKGLVKLPFLDNAFMAVEFEGIKAWKTDDPNAKGGCVYDVPEIGFRTRPINQKDLENEKVDAVSKIIKLTDPTVFHGNLDKAVKEYVRLTTPPTTTPTTQQRQDLGVIAKGISVATSNWKDKFTEAFSAGGVPHDSNPKIKEIIDEMDGIINQLNTDIPNIKNGPSYPSIPNLKEKIDTIIEKIKALQQENTPKLPRIQNVLATNIGYNDATLTWQGDPRFTKYVISYKTADGGELLETVTGNRLDLIKLQENSVYGFKIEGYVGDDVVDTYENGTFKTLQNKIPMPENVKLLKKDDNTITLTWDNNKLHESYKVVYKDKNGVERYIPLGKENTVTLRELNPDENYTYSIVAVGGNLESDPATGGFMSGMCHGLIVSEVNRVIEGTRITLSILDDCVSDISWNTGSTEATISDVPRETTKYIVTCTIKKGVTTKTCKDEVTIIVDKKCAEVVATTLTNEVEQGDPVILRATGCESEIKWEKGYLSNIIVGNTKTLTIYPVESSIYSVSCQDLKGSTCYSQTQVNVNCTLKLISNPSENHNITFGESGSVIITAIGCVGGRLEWDLDAERFIKGEVIKPNQFRVSDIRRNKKATVNATCYLGNKECHADEIEVTRPAAICGNAAEYQHTVLSNVDNQLLINIFSKNIGDTWGPQIESIKWSQDGEYSVKGEKVSSRSYERNSYFRKYFPVPQKSVIFEYVVNYQDPAATCSFSVPYTPKIGDKNNVPTYPCTEFLVKFSENPTICQPISFTTNCPSVLTWDTPSIIENKVTITTPGSYSYKATCIIDGISVAKTVDLTVKDYEFKIDYVSSTNIVETDPVVLKASCNNGCKSGTILWKVGNTKVGEGNEFKDNPSRTTTYTAECNIDGTIKRASTSITVTPLPPLPPPNPCDFYVYFDKDVYSVGDQVNLKIWGGQNLQVFALDAAVVLTQKPDQGSYRVYSSENFRITLQNKSYISYKIINIVSGVGTCETVITKPLSNISTVNLSFNNPNVLSTTAQKRNCDRYTQGGSTVCFGMPHNLQGGEYRQITEGNNTNLGVFAIGISNSSQDPKYIGLTDKVCNSNRGDLQWFSDFDMTKGLGAKEEKKDPNGMPIYYTSVPTPTETRTYYGKCTFSDKFFCTTTLTFNPKEVQKLCQTRSATNDLTNNLRIDNSTASEETAPCLPVKVIEAAKFILTDVLCNKLKSIQGDEELKLTTLSATLAEQGIQLSAITPSIIQDLKDGKCSSVVEQLTSGITGSSTIENINEILKDSDGILNDVLDEIDRNKPTLTATTITPASCGLNNGAVKLSATGGTPPYQYSKDGTTFQNSDTFEALAVGKYTFYVKDAKGERGTIGVDLKGKLGVEIEPNVPISANARMASIYDIGTITVQWEATGKTTEVTFRTGVKGSYQNNVLTIDEPLDLKGTYYEVYNADNHDVFLGFYKKDYTGPPCTVVNDLYQNKVCVGSTCIEGYLKQKAYYQGWFFEDHKNKHFNTTYGDLASEIDELITELMSKDQYISFIQKTKKGNYTTEELEGLKQALIDYKQAQIEAFGLATPEYLQKLVDYFKKCNNPTYTGCDVGDGIVPRCWWDNDNPLIQQTSIVPVPFSAGIIDGAYSTLKGAAITINGFQQLVSCWLNPVYYFWDINGCSQTRANTMNVLGFIGKLIDGDKGASNTLTDMKSKIGIDWQTWKDQTFCLGDTPAQTRCCEYHQGKLFFDIASLFFGIGEANIALKGAKVANIASEVSTKMTALFSKISIKSSKLLLKPIKDVGIAIAVAATVAVTDPAVAIKATNKIEQLAIRTAGIVTAEATLLEAQSIAAKGVATATAEAEGVLSKMASSVDGIASEAKDILMNKLSTGDILFSRVDNATQKIIPFALMAVATGVVSTIQPRETTNCTICTGKTLSQNLCDKLKLLQTRGGANGTAGVTKLCNNLSVSLENVVDKLLTFTNDEIQAFFVDLIPSPCSNAFLCGNVTNLDAAAIAAWRVVYKGRCATCDIKREVDWATLTKVKLLLNETDFLSTITQTGDASGQDALSDIIAKNKRAGCTVCLTTAAPNLKTLPEYLADVENFVTYYGTLPGASTVLGKQGIRNASGSYSPQVEATAFILKVLNSSDYQIATGGNDNITSFEYQYDDATNGNCSADIVTTTAFVECKSWTPYGTNTWDKMPNKQFLTYLGNISSMNGLQYWFDGDKADLPTLKTNFQTIFQKTDANGDNIVFEKIWGNVNLRGSLIPQRPLESIPQWKERAKTEFTIMVNSQDNNLYKFIKVK